MTDGRANDTRKRVAELLEKGMTVLEIARLLSISPQAVYKQINRHNLTKPTERQSA
jgi:DNA invertase Pin-like site-specific DNA recombinase